MLDFDTLAVTIQEADAYHTKVGHSDWTGSNEVKTAALWRGQSYIAGKYNARFTVAFEPDDAPDPVKYAIAAAARLELLQPGRLTPNLERGGELKSLAEAVDGAVSRTRVWKDSAPTDELIAEVENLLIGSGVIAAKSSTFTGFVQRA